MPVLSMLRMAVSPRFVVYTLCILFTAALFFIGIAFPAWFGVVAVPLAIFAWLSVLGTHDLIQTRHSVLRKRTRRTILTPTPRCRR